jgi:hypothetical protein
MIIGGRDTSCDQQRLHVLVARMECTFSATQKIGHVGSARKNREKTKIHTERVQMERVATRKLRDLEIDDRMSQSI